MSLVTSPKTVKTKREEKGVGINLREGSYFQILESDSSHFYLCKIQQLVFDLSVFPHTIMKCKFEAHTRKVEEYLVSEVPPHSGVGWPLSVVLASNL